VRLPGEGRPAVIDDTNMQPGGQAGKSERLNAGLRPLNDANQTLGE